MTAGESLVPELLGTTNAAHGAELYTVGFAVVYLIV